MFYFLSGATAAGKSTVSRAVAARLPRLVQVEEDARLSRTSGERRANLELWIQDALEHERHGRDVILGSQSPLGELLASPSATRLEGIAACLLDAHDFVRLRRWTERGISEDWPMTMDHFCWAAFHRLHARNPQFEQRVLLAQPGPPGEWNRWTGWTAGDRRWTVPLFDTSDRPFETVVDLVVDWIEGVRLEGAPLTRSGAWWT